MIAIPLSLHQSFTRALQPLHERVFLPTYGIDCRRNIIAKPQSIVDPILDAIHVDEDEHGVDPIWVFTLDSRLDVLVAFHEV